MLLLLVYYGESPHGTLTKGSHVNCAHGSSPHSKENQLTIKKRVKLFVFSLI